VLPAGLLAPDSWAAGQASEATAPSGSGGVGSKRPSLDDQVKRFAETLDLNETQQSEVKKILERRQDQGSRIIKDPSPSGGDRVGKLHALNESTVAQIRAVLPTSKGEVQSAWAERPPKNFASTQRGGLVKGQQT